MKLPPDIKAAFLKELRTREQWFGEYFRDESCCVIGALAYACAEARKLSSHRVNEMLNGTLIDFVKSSVGCDQFPTLTLEGQPLTLLAINDKLKIPFPQIADLVEAQL